MQILLNNLIIIGIFSVILLISYLTGNTVFGFLHSLYSSTNPKNKILLFIVEISGTVITLALYFLAGRYLLRGTGILTHDLLSFCAIFIIYAIWILYRGNSNIGALLAFIIQPNMFIAVMLGRVPIVPIVISFILSLASITFGVISKSGIQSIV